MSACQRIVDSTIASAASTGGFINVWIEVNGFMQKKSFRYGLHAFNHREGYSYSDALEVVRMVRERLGIT